MPPDESLQSDPMAPVASGTPGAPTAERPPFSLEDLEAAPVTYWRDLEAGYTDGDLSVDDFVASHRQRAHDYENPLLIDQRGVSMSLTKTAAAPAPAPDETTQPVAPPQPSTAEQISGLLATIGLQGIRPVQPASSLVEALYGQAPNKEADPVYRTLQRLAGGLDMALTAINVPVTGIGDLANVILAPLTLGLQAAGADKATVQGFVENARLVPEMAAAFGMGAGALGTLGKVGNLTGIGAELAPLLQQQGRLVQIEQAFSATMRDLKLSRGEILIPGPDDLSTLAAKYEAAVIEARRGGPRPHPQVQAEAQAMIDQGLVSMDTVQTILPGTSLNDADAVAVVKVLAESGLRLKALAQTALTTGTPEDLTAVMQQLYLHAQVDPKRIGVVTEAGRTLSAMNDPTAGLNRFLVQFEEVLRNGTLGTDPMAIVRSLADLKDPGQLAVLARQASKPGFWAMFREYYVNGLLWGPRTWMANLVGNTASTLWAIPERQLAGWLGHGQGGVAAGEAWEMFQGILGATNDAWRLADEAFRQGESQFGKSLGMMDAAGNPRALDKMEMPQRAISADSLELTGMPGQAMDWFGTVIRFPGRVLAGTDDFFKVINYRGELRALAFRQASQEAAGQGMKGKALSTFMTSRMNQIMADPPLSVKRDADAFALYQTFTKELGETGQKIQALAATPAGGIILPFVRTPINLFKYAAERTPLGLAMKEVRDDLFGADLVKRDLARAKLAMGSLTMSLAGVLAYQGAITGAGPTDPESRRILQGLGWQPYSVRIGGQWVSYSRTEPIGMLLGLAADWVEGVTNAEGEGIEKTGEIGAAVVTAVAKNFASRTFVKGLAETMAAISDPERAANARTASLLVSLLPASALIRQVEQIMDPTMAEARTVMDRFMAQVPGLSSKLPPRRTLWGEPVHLSGIYGPIAMSTPKNDPVLKELVALGANVPEVPRVVQRIELNSEERDYWAVQRGRMKVDGQTLRETLAETIASEEYRGAGLDHRAFLLEMQIRNFQLEAFEKVKAKFPEVERSIEKAQEEKANAADAPPQAVPSTPLLRSLNR